MSTFKIERIKTHKQYNLYCKRHEELILLDDDSNISEIELLEIVIEKYDDEIEGEKIKELSPVELLREIIEEDELSQTELAAELNISKQLLSNVLNYKRLISKELAINLSSYFAMKQEAFGRLYSLNDKEVKYKPAKVLLSNSSEDAASKINRIKKELKKYFIEIDSCTHHKDGKSQDCKYFSSNHRKNLEKMLNV